MKDNDILYGAEVMSETEREYLQRNTASGKRKILIIDSDQKDFAELCGILEEEYELLQAPSGQKAMSILKNQGEEIALVILEISLLGMNGYLFMKMMRGDPYLSAIPMVAITGIDNDAEEVRCLEQGASDVMSKPYNPEIVRHRIASIIRLRESAAMLNILEFDYLTGLYNREFFFRKAASILEQYPEREFDLICSDIENFKLVNDRYSAKQGDDILRYLAGKYRKHLKEAEICGRISGDVFAFLSVHREDYSKSQFAKDVEEGFSDSPVPNLVIKFGVYEKVDRSLSVSAMYDRAMLALNQIKYHYGKTIAVYDDALRQSLLRDQRILDEMEAALEKEQFVVYYQPKHDINSGNVSGAEALVRWIHPEYGFMSPNDFIPLFERNGFITKLDLYVWEKVCQTMQEWKRQGLPQIPISVNLSRADFDLVELACRIKELADRYDIDHELLHLEVTELAYTENARQIIAAVNELRDMGFKIEMDDFGSGYSSLNMLNELSIDVLKLDMRFVQTKGMTGEKSILSFIINLSKWMALSTVAEGAETKEQVEELRSLGCDHVQGYYYAKPMKVEDFETYLKKAKC